MSTTSQSGLEGPSGVMIRDEHIEAAVAQGILTAEQAVRLRDLALGGLRKAEPVGPLSEPDDEKFRLIGGFNDVFVTIGVGLLVAALFALADTLGFKIGFSVLGLITAWGLSEVFSRRMRLALPSIALALMFAGAGAFVGASIGGLLLSLAGMGPETIASFSMLLSGVGAGAAALMHERRFHVPIDSAIAAVGATCAIVGGLTVVAPDWTSEHKSLLTAILGLSIFVAAVRVDASDPQRVTRRADIAFWLHLLAAPMIVHAVIPLITGNVSTIGTGQAIAILALFVLLGLVAVAIDRRALLVSGLSYAGIAIGYLLSQSVEESMGLSLTLLSLAVVVLGLSAGWRPLRRAILPLLPLGSLRQFVPPTT